MELKTTILDLYTLTNNFNYRDDGDLLEQTFSPSIIDLFPNSEIFWKMFVTPITHRIDPNAVTSPERIRIRPSVSQNLVDLSTINYSVFLNLVYASQALIKQQISYFENFYTHLGSTCDLVEELITQLYFITLDCEGLDTEILQRLSKTKYLKIAANWYDENYSNTYVYYLSKGKTAPINILGRSNILAEYFIDAIEWKEYSKLAQQIRTYRNVVVHNSQIGTRYDQKGIYYAPKKSKISEYKSWHKVFNVSDRKFTSDFINRDTQMIEDLALLKTALNKLLLKPIEHLNRLLYTECNSKLLAKYDISLQ